MKLSAIDLNLLVALDALLSEKNVTRAAARIGRSQPATSHALARARALFEDPLLVKTRGRLELSARARMIAPKLQRLLRELGAVIDTHGDFDPRAIESITLGTTDYVGFVLLPHLFRLFEEIAPQLTVRVRTIEGPDALEPLSGGVLDLALGTFPQIPVGLRTETLFDEEFVCMRRNGHPTRRRRLSVDEFAALGHVLVASPNLGLGPVDLALAKTGHSRHIAAAVPQFLVAPSIVAATDWVLTTGRRIATRLGPPLGLETFACPVALKPFSVRMLWHERSEADSVGRWLREALRTATLRMLADERGAVRRPRRKARGHP